MTSFASLANKRVLVVGGTRGIGRAVAVQFARAGARVLANYVRDVRAADALKAEATQRGWHLDTCRADVSSEKGLERLLAALDPDFPTLSAVVYCAATGVHRPVQELTLRHFDWTFALNVRAFFELVRQLIPRLEAGSSVLAVSSEGAARAVPHYTLVGSSKGALESMVRHLAVELAPRGIRLNIIAPGSVITDAWNALPDRDKRLADATARTPLQRLVTLEEVAQAAQFLCSDAASGIVGHTLVVDGGFRIRE